MFNPLRSWKSAGIVATAMIAGAAPASAATYNWCPTASSGPIICNNCTVNLTCDLSGYGITIRGRYVTLNGQGHYIWGYNPSNPVPAINDLGTGTTIQNIYVYYPSSGIFVSQEGLATGAKTVQNVGVYGAVGRGIDIKGIEKSSAVPYAQTTYLRDSWSYENNGGLIVLGGNSQLGQNQAAPTIVERVTSNNNRWVGVLSFRSKIDISDSDVWSNAGEGLDFQALLYGRIHGNRAGYNNQFGFHLSRNQDTYINANYGHFNLAGGCWSAVGADAGAQGGVWNDFDRAWGPGCTN